MGELTATQVIVITASLAAVGATAIYFIQRKPQARALPPAPVPPRAPTHPSATPHPHAAHRGMQARQQPAVTYHRVTPPSTYETQSPYRATPYHPPIVPPFHHPHMPAEWPATVTQPLDASLEKLAHVPIDMLTHWVDSLHPHTYAATPSPPPVHDTSPYVPASYASHPMQAHDHPVTYTPYPMPSLGGTQHPQHPYAPAAAPAAPASPYSPTYWVDMAHRLDLIKPGDRLINWREAAHYLNTMGLGHFPEVDAPTDALKSALHSFQLAHHLPVTGELDPETSAALIYQVFTSATPQFIAPGF